MRVCGLVVGPPNSSEYTNAENIQEDDQEDSQFLAQRYANTGLQNSNSPAPNYRQSIKKSASSKKLKTSSKQQESGKCADAAADGDKARVVKPSLSPPKKKITGSESPKVQNKILQKNQKKSMTPNPMQKKDQLIQTVSPRFNGMQDSGSNFNPAEKKPAVKDKLYSKLLQDQYSINQGDIRQVLMFNSSQKS